MTCSRSLRRAKAADLGRRTSSSDGHAMSIYRRGPSPANSCPRCQSNLVVDGAEREMRVCETCGGVFAGVEATRRIISSMDRALLEIGFQAAFGKTKPRDDHRLVGCPECLIDMQKMRIEAAA